MLDTDSEPCASSRDSPLADSVQVLAIMDGVVIAAPAEPQDLPKHVDRVSPSLRGQAAARIARALVSAVLPADGQVLASRAGVSSSQVSKVLALLVDEGLFEKKSRGPVLWVDTRGLHVCRPIEPLTLGWRGLGREDPRNHNCTGGLRLSLPLGLVTPGPRPLSEKVRVRE